MLIPLCGRSISRPIGTKGFRSFASPACRRLVQDDILLTLFRHPARWRRGGEGQRSSSAVRSSGAGAMDLSGRANSGLQGTFLPTKRRGGVVAGKVHSAFRPRNVRKEGSHLPGLHGNVSATGPFVFIPALGCSSLEVFVDSRMDFVESFEHESDSLALAHGGDSACLRACHVRLQNSASARLTVRGIPNPPDREVG